MKISKYKMILLSLISLTLASCGSTTNAAPLPAPPTNHHISAIEAAEKAINAAKKVVDDVTDDLLEK